MPQTGKGITRLIKRQLLFYFSIKTYMYIVTPHLTISLVYFLHTLKMIHNASDRKGDNKVNLRGNFCFISQLKHTL